MNIHFVMPFYRENLKDIVLGWTGELGVILHPIQFPDESKKATFTPTTHVCPLICDPVPPWPEANPVNHKINQFIEHAHIEDDDYYWIMGDDNLVEKETVDAVLAAKEDVVIVSMKRGKHVPLSPSIVNRHPISTLFARPENMAKCNIGFEQMVIKGKVFKTLKYNDYSSTADGEMAIRLKETMGDKIQYLPNVYVLFNYFEPGRWDVKEEKGESGEVKLVIATPFYNMQGWSNYISSLSRTLLYLTRSTSMQVDFWALSGDSYIERARNTLANKFMRSEYTHLLFIDSDMGWDETGLLRLLVANVPLVGAGFPCKNTVDFYGCMLNCNPDGTPKVNSKGLISAWNVPTGFCLIKKEVFTKLAESFPDDKYGYQAPDDIKPLHYYDFFGHYFRAGDKDLRDDVYFCRKWASIGGEIWVEPRINIGHAQFFERRGNYHEFLQSCPGGSRDINKVKING